MNEETEGKSLPWLRPELVAPWWEIAAFLALILGQSVYLSSWAGWHGSSRYFRNYFITYHSLLTHISWQAWYMAIMLFLLHWRGWKPADFQIKVGWKSTGQGLVLTMVEHIFRALSLAVIYFAISTARELGHPETLVRSLRFHLQVPSGLLYNFVRIIFDVVNSFREELICMGYAFTQFAAKRGPLFALILMVILRLSYHTYQGAFPLFSHAVFFTILGLWYWKSRNLWPLIVAHTLFNLMPLRLYSLLTAWMAHH